MSSIDELADRLRSASTDLPLIDTIALGIANLDAPNNIDEPDSFEPDWEKNSLAVIAAGEHGGYVMFHVGAYLDQEIDNTGRDAEELGILPDQPGIWIWEGKYLGGGQPTREGDYTDSDPVGRHRPPTEGEWAAIHVGSCPWDPDDWIVKRPDSQLTGETCDDIIIDHLPLKTTNCTFNGQTFDALISPPLTHTEPALTQKETMLSTSGSCTLTLLSAPATSPTLICPRCRERHAGYTGLCSSCLVD